MAATEGKLNIFVADTPNGKKIILAAEELGLDYDVKAIRLSAGEQKSPEFLAVNPNGKIPAIVDARGEKPVNVWESGAILLHLAEGTDLLPSEPTARASALSWLFLQQTGLGPNAGNLYHFLTKKEEAGAYSLQRFGQETKRILEVIEGRLATSPFLAGEALTVADVSHFHWLAAILTRLPAAFPEATAELGLSAEAFPSISKWVKEMSGRPSVAATEAVFASDAFKTPAE
ncbi:yfcG [Symbiodinium sp. KB8]|nr:yfcG [Symbiodinium sp. KB8]